MVGQRSTRNQRDPCIVSIYLLVLNTSVSVSVPEIRKGDSSGTEAQYRKSKVESIVVNS